jgi:hypothetical protein
VSLQISRRTKIIAAIIAALSGAAATYLAVKHANDEARARRREEEGQVRP